MTIYFRQEMEEEHHSGRNAAKQRSQIISEITEQNQRLTRQLRDVSFNPVGNTALMLLKVILPGPPRPGSVCEVSVSVLSVSVCRQSRLPVGSAPAVPGRPFRDHLRVGVAAQPSVHRAYPRANRTPRS